MRHGYNYTVDEADWIDTYESYRRCRLSSCRLRESTSDSTECILPMRPIVILEAFGEFPCTELIDSERERERREWEHPPTGVVDVGLLHRSFEARAELMGWTSTSRHTPLPPPLWNMFEAGLTDNGDDASLIGWVYVGLANPVDLSKKSPRISQSGSTEPGWAAVQLPPGYMGFTAALPVVLLPLVQCLDDALRRIGITAVSGFQLICYGANLQPGGRYRSHLIGGSSWFDVRLQEEPTNALVALDEGLICGPQAAELMRKLRYRNDFPFSFDLLSEVPDQYQVRTPGSVPKPNVSFEPSDVGVSVKMPEWTASAVGWVLATVVDSTRAIVPGVENFALRITRVR